VELISQLAPVNNKVQPVQLVADAAPLHGNHGTNRYVEAAIIVIGIAVGIALLRFAEGFFVPLLVGLLTSYVLAPLVSGLQRLHVPRAIGAAIVLVAVATLAAGIVYALSDDAARIADQLPASAKKLRQMLHEQIGNKPNPIASVHKAAAELDRAAKEASGTTLVAAIRNVSPDTNGVARLEAYLIAGTSGALLRISELLLALMLAYFLLTAGDSFRRKLMRIAGPSLARRRVTVEILNEIHDQVQHYMLVLLMTNVLIGLATWGLFAAAGLESAGLWGFVAALLHMIPYAGSAVLAGAAGVAALIQFESWTSALLLAAGALGVATLIGTILNTWMNSWVSHMNPVMMFGSLLLFGWLWGAWGLLLALPLLAVLKAIAERVEGMNAIAELIRDP